MADIDCGGELGAVAFEKDFDGVLVQVSGFDGRYSDGGRVTVYGTGPGRIRWVDYENKAEAVGAAANLCRILGNATDKVAAAIRWHDGQ